MVTVATLRLTPPNWRGNCRAQHLDVKTNQQYIAVLHPIVLALNAELADFPSFRQRTTGDQVIVMDNLCPNKASFQIRVNHPGRLWRQQALWDRPGTDFFFTCR